MDDTIQNEYLRLSQKYWRDLPKTFPNLWKYIMSKRYILPAYRRADYAKQEACDYFMLDTLFGYLDGKLSLADHVAAHAMNNFIAGLHYNRPTFYLERELGEPLLRAKLPLDYYASDINWRFPALRIYLPHNLLTITRDGKASSAMYIDISHIAKGGQGMHFPAPIDEELKMTKGKGLVPMIHSEYEGMAATCVMNFDSPLSLLGYAASSKLERQTIAKIMSQTHEELNTPFKSDETDVEFMDRMLALAINILLFLSAVPMEYETNEVLRKARIEGKHMMPGLYPAKFIGASQLRANATNRPPSIPTGKHLASHWRSGHWHRYWYGPKKSLNKLIFVLTHHVGQESES